MSALRAQDMFWFGHASVAYGESAGASGGRFLDQRNNRLVDNGTVVAQNAVGFGTCQEYR